MSWWLGLRRVAHIIFVVLHHLLGHVASRGIALWPKLAARLHATSSPGPQRLRTAIEELGGTFVKFGQVLALQSDVLPLAHCEALYDLLDQMPPFNFEHVERVFVEEVGSRPSQIFDSFDSQPIATGSIGQVHEARLGEQKLAIKVRRPTVERDFAVDIRLMTAAIRLIRLAHLRKLNWMIEPMSEFLGWTREELDYRREARYMEALGRNARDNPCERIPAVLWEYTTRRILTVELLEAVSVLDYIRAREHGDQFTLHRVQALGFDPNQFARNVVENFLNDAFKHGMFHADLHPANLMILDGNRVGYIDFGIFGVLSPYSRRHLVALTLAYARGDLDSLCASFFRVSTLEPSANAEEFRKELSVLARNWYGRGRTEPRLRRSITLMMLDMLTLSRKTGIWPQRDVIKYIRSAIALDGLIKRFAPGFDVGRHLETVCERQLKWDPLRALVSYDTLVTWFDANAHLIRDGAFRSIAFIGRLANGELPVSATVAGSANGESDGALRRRAVLLAALTLGVSLLTTLQHQPVHFGVNLAAAGVVIAAAAAIKTFETIRRLA